MSQSITSLREALEETNAHHLEHIRIALNITDSY